MAKPFVALARRPSVAQEQKRDRIPELDGLRGFAILMVVSFHYFYDPVARMPKLLHHLQRFFDLGWTGVDLFFVLSGFLIFGVLLEAQQSTSYFKTFYVRRFFRILPLYYLWILLLLLVAWGGVSFTNGHLEPGLRTTVLREIWPHFFFLQNLRASHYTPLAGWWLASTWSLAVEEQFYLVAPSLVRFFSKRQLMLVLFFAVGAAPCCRFVLHVFAANSSWAAYMWTPCRADALALGGIGGVLWHEVNFRRWVSRNKAVLNCLFGLFLAGMAFLAIWFPDPRAGLTQIAGYSWVAFFYLLLLFLVLADPGGVIAAMARMRWLREWGRISYCVYLIHGAVKYCCLSALHRDTGHFSDRRSVVGVMLALAGTYALAKLSWRFLEQPLLQKARRFEYEGA